MAAAALGSHLILRTRNCLPGPYRCLSAPGKGHQSAFCPAGLGLLLLRPDKGPSPRFFMTAEMILEGAPAHVAG
jgi:hypothetical protein